MRVLAPLLITAAGLIVSCVPVATNQEPAGWLSLAGDAVNSDGVVLGSDNRSGVSAILSLSVAAANYHTNNSHGYNWSIKQLSSVQELTSINAAAGRFQLLAETNPPMSRKLTVGSKLSSGKYKAELFIYYNKYKIGETDNLLNHYQLIFSLDN